MTDPLTFVRDADPAAGVDLEPAARARIGIALDQVLNAAVAVDARPPAPAKTAVRRRLMLSFAGVTATAAAAVALAALPTGGSRNPVAPIAPAPASAAVVLRQLGATAAQAPAPHGKYIYVQTRSYVTHMRPRPGGGGSFATLVPYDSEEWLARDGSEQIRRGRERWEKATYPTAQDRVDAQAAGTPPWPRGDEPPVRYTDVKVAGFTVAELNALPTDPAALRARLEHADLGYKSPSPLVTATGLLLGSPLTPRDVRVAAFAVLRGLPGARLVSGATDPAGRSGEGVEFDDDAWRTLFIFDTSTSALIATRSIGEKELPGRNISGWTLQLDSKGADSAPAAQDSRALQRAMARRDTKLLRRARAARTSHQDRQR